MTKILILIRSSSKFMCINNEVITRLAVFGFRSFSKITILHLKDLSQGLTRQLVWYLGLSGTRLIVIQIEV